MRILLARDLSFLLGQHYQFQCALHIATNVQAMAKLPALASVTEP